MLDDFLIGPQIDEEVWWEERMELFEEWALENESGAIEQSARSLASQARNSGS